MKICSFAYFFEPANDLGIESTLDEFISYIEKFPLSYIINCKKKLKYE